MDRRTQKLQQLGVDPVVAEELVKAGLDNPRKIKKAKTAALQKAKADKDKGVGRWRGE